MVRLKGKSIMALGEEIKAVLDGYGRDIDEVVEKYSFLDGRYRFEDDDVPEHLLKPVREAVAQKYVKDLPLGHVFGIDEASAETGLNPQRLGNILKSHKGLEYVQMYTWKKVNRLTGKWKSISGISDMDKFIEDLNRKVQALPQKSFRLKDIATIMDLHVVGAKALLSKYESEIELEKRYVDGIPYWDKVSSKED